MKKDTSKINHLHLLWLSGLICLFILLLGPLQESLKAQPVLSAKSIALGGGGTAYLSGFEATFWNPANLVVNNYGEPFHFGIGHTGILYEPVLSSDAPGDQLLNFTDSFYPFRTGTASITDSQRANIISNNYSRRNLLSQHQARADVILGGALWQRGVKAFSIAARIRMASRIEVGRGWYSEEFIPSGNHQVRDLTLNQQKNQLLELSVGFAREFTFFNGLSPRLNKLFVGIAPKIVVAGPSLDATYDAYYVRNENGSNSIYVTDFFYRATGEYAQTTFDYLVSENPQQAILNNIVHRYRFQPTGYGLGFDFGLTYLLPLGDELPTIESNYQNAVVSKSIRFALSINDIGMIHYTQNPLTLSSPRDADQISQQPAMNSMFIGAGGQYYSYLDDAGAIPNPLLNAQEISRDNYSSLLPTSVNAGILVELSRLKLMSDLTLGLNNTAFTTTRLMVHLGLEIRPLRHIPIRLGTRLASGLPTRIGMGTGIESQYWNFTIGAQVILRSRALTSEFVSGAFAGIQIHL